jgi:hypothetical protein
MLFFEIGEANNPTVDSSLAIGTHHISIIVKDRYLGRIRVNLEVHKAADLHTFLAGSVIESFYGN